MKTILLFVFASFLLSTNLLASEDNVWSLQECIDYALGNNLEIKQQMLNEERTEADLRQSYANLFPSLDAASSQGFNYGRTIDRFTNEFATERVFFQNLYGTSDVVLFSGFQNINNIRYNIARNTAVRYDTEKLENDIILAIAAAYLQILYHEEIALVANEQMEVIDQQLNRSRILFEGGSISRSALLEVEAQHASEQLNLLTAENNLRLAYLELVQLLDLDPEEPFIVEKLSVDITNELALRDPEVVVQKAFEVEPSVLAARNRISMHERLLSYSRGAYSPRLAFIAQVGSGYSEAASQVVGSVPTGEVQQIGYTESNEAVYQDIYMPLIEKKPYRDQINDNYNTTLMLNLTIPIFNRLQARNRVNQARIDLESARVNFEQQKNTLSKIIYQAHADAMASWQQYVSTEKSREAFEESFRFTSERFDMGMISAIEYNEARVRLARSKAEALQAKYDYLFKVKVLEFYQSGNLEF